MVNYRKETEDKYCRTRVKLKFDTPTRPTAETIDRLDRIVYGHANSYHGQKVGTGQIPEHPFRRSTNYISKQDDLIVIYVMPMMLKTTLPWHVSLREKVRNRINLHLDEYDIGALRGRMDSDEKLDFSE